MNRNVVLHLAKIAGISGAETHLLSLLPRLRERDWDVRLLQLHEDEAGAYEFADELRDRGVPVGMIRLRADVDPLAFARVTAHLARARPRILHTHLVHADVYGQLAGALASVPLRISTKHGFNEFRENSGFAFADRAVGGLAHVHIAISRGLARYLADVEGFGEETFSIVHYGIVAGREPTAPPDEPRLLCVGRLIPIKGHIVLLRAFADARREVPDLTLEIAGRGPLEPALKALAKELRIADAVRFLGFVSPVHRAIDDCAVVVVPSLGEGFGMAALEAMERARPVVAADIGGLGELVVDGETGLLVPPGEAEPLARALVALARDPSRRRAMGAAGRRRALEHFAEERNVDRTELLYRDLLSAKRPTDAAARIINRKSNGTR
jgi:glycosyltransferase involved in cell wall biosynthesis